MYIYIECVASWHEGHVWDAHTAGPLSRVSLEDMTGSGVLAGSHQQLNTLATKHCVYILHILYIYMACRVINQNSV